MSLYLDAAGERFGTVVRRREVGHFVLRLSTYPADLRMPTVHHPLAYFSYVVRGGVEEWRGREWFQFEPPSVHFHPARDPHAGRVGPSGLTCLSIIPQDAIADRVAESPRDALASSPELSATRLARRCYREFWEQDDASDLLVEAAALELVGALLRQGHVAAPRRPAWLLDVRDHLDHHFADRIPMSDPPATAGVHPVHVVRAFRRHLGTTPGAYVRRRRMDLACDTLVASMIPIADIALAAGFSSQAHFTRAFTRELGLPPAAYRRRHGRLSN